MSEAVRAFADKVEAFFQEEGIALTMGGEPTFVAAEPEAPEWNTAAMGEAKLGYARRMAGVLIGDVYAGALAMQVFGKWYPGEPLPRWNVVVLHAAEAALWPATERLLLDDIEAANAPEVSEPLARELAVGLGVGNFLFPAVEQDGGAPAGWVLPLDFAEGEWISSDWGFAAERPIELLMGDSPVGLRLPLNQLPEGSLRTALTLEVRKGALEVFLPPLEWKGFRTLVATIRRVAEALDLRDLVFCGYAPKGAGGALTGLGLAADPGVLEVNLPPVASWPAYDEVLRQCAAAADAVELRLVKYQLNGRVYGTGGGAHLAFGGPSKEANPFLHDPRRIASILRYWQHHPALSYLFTGQYVGSGSQAPRGDEGPSHGIYELEVACEGLESLGAQEDGEWIDQLLKNLLTDSAGNTHRAELCFDKFHNHALPNGCLGIIEMRAFGTFHDIETMSRVALFVRTVLARLFKAPFGAGLVRYGPELNDRYFLPAFLWRDFCRICEDLAGEGFPFDAEWLRPVLEFRCPVAAHLEVEGGRIELRRAFESWPLMAEESRGTATVRVVDNSTDRLQLRLSSIDLLEFGKLLVNGVEVPFEAVDGQWICGLRYKCASAYPALHPQVPIQSPLRFEWVDRVSQKTVRAARYHYWNPDGPTYEGRPAGAEEANSRRAARWRDAPDLVGNHLAAIQPKRSPEYRYTLDLRRQPGA